MDIALYQLNDYYIYRLDGVSRNGGEVVIYVKNTIKHILRNQITYIVYDLLECLSFELTDLSKEKINDTCIHRQPDSNIYDVLNKSEKRFRN